jgi:hypothetical protein
MLMRSDDLRPDPKRKPVAIAGTTPTAIGTNVAARLIASPERRDHRAPPFCAIRQTMLCCGHFRRYENAPAQLA